MIKLILRFCIYCTINDKNLLERKECWTLNWEQGLGNPGWILIQNFTILTSSSSMIWHQAKLISYFSVFNILSTMQGVCGPHFTGILKKQSIFSYLQCLPWEPSWSCHECPATLFLAGLGYFFENLYNVESQLLSTLSPLLLVEPLLQY